MKTSLELSEHLFRSAKALAKKRKSSVRALIEEGLRYILSQSQKKMINRPKILTFGGDGLTDEMQKKGYSWDAIREEIYDEPKT